MQKEKPTEIIHNALNPKTPKPHEDQIVNLSLAQTIFVKRGKSNHGQYSERSRAEPLQSGTETAKYRFKLVQYACGLFNSAST